MKLSSCIAVAALACVGLGGCVAFSEQHQTTESRYSTPEAQAYWTDRRWRHDIADYWDRELERQSAVRLARDFGH
jgi:hypothetical protein